MKTLPLPPPAHRALQKLAQDLSLARRRRRLSQTSLAARSGVSLSTIKRLENGNTGCSLEHLARVLQVLGEVERLEGLLDTGVDAIGLLLMNDEVPKKIRPRRTSAAA